MKPYSLDYQKKLPVILILLLMLVYGCRESENEPITPDVQNAENENEPTALTTAKTTATTLITTTMVMTTLSYQCQQNRVSATNCGFTTPV